MAGADNNLDPYEAPLGPPLIVSARDFDMAELRRAIQKLSTGKAKKDGDIPIEVFKALAMEPDMSLGWLLNLCNHCWQNKTLPSECSTASVAMRFKKGGPADPNNYRPICLLLKYCMQAFRIASRVL